MTNSKFELPTLLCLFFSAILPAQDLELAQTKYELAVDAAESDYKLKKAQLLRFYDQALDGVIEQFKRSGKLDGIMECRKERQRVEDDAFVSLDADSGVDPALLNLRKKLSSGMRDLELKRTAQLTTLYQNFARGADQLIVRFTQGGEIKQAKKLKAMKETFLRQFTAALKTSQEAPAEDKSNIKNGSFEDGLKHWEVKGDATIKTETSLKTGRTRSYLRLQAGTDYNDILIAVAKKVDPSIGYRVSFRYRVSPDFVPPPPSIPGRKPFFMRIARTERSLTSWSPQYFEAEKRDGKWHDLDHVLFFPSSDYRLLIGIESGQGYVELDDIKLTEANIRR